MRFVAVAAVAAVAEVPKGLESEFTRADVKAAVMLQCAWRCKQAYIKMVDEYIMKRYRAARLVQVNENGNVILHNINLILICVLYCIV